jgi:hypothetical protein
VNESFFDLHWNEDWFNAWLKCDLDEMKRINGIRLQMERDIIRGIHHVKPMDRATFEALWGDDHGAE